MNFIARWVRIMIHRKIVAFRRHLPPNRRLLSPVGQSDKDTPVSTHQTRPHITAGTRVMSDMWTAYDCLKDENYTHLTVNHSLNFVDPDTDAHTQCNKNTWWSVKRSMPRTEHPKISSKAIYRNGCVISTIRSHNRLWLLALWIRSFCQNITKHIADLYAQRCINIYIVRSPMGNGLLILSVDRTAVCTVRDVIATSWR